ncbi:MAG: ATPase [Cyclobacteriaceae bacterium]|nr:ATPase [Cyclobacteriaceae bacterium]
MPDYNRVTSLAKMLKKTKQKIILFYRLLRRELSERIINQGRFTLIHTLRITYKISNTLIPLATLAAVGLVVYDFGFNAFYSHEAKLYHILLWVLLSFKILFVIRFISEWVEVKKLKAHLYNFSLVVLVYYLHYEARKIIGTDTSATTDLLVRKLIFYTGILFLFLTEASGLLKYLYRRRQNTAFIFIVSFAVIIIAGTLLLMVPKATFGGISAIDAFFTSTSAVCVTGLTVVNTSTHFTSVGKIIILFLMQIGGLGIMTFTGLFAYLAAGSVSFHNQMALKSMVSSKRMSNVMTIVGRIILVTLFFEAIGAFLIFVCLDENLFPQKEQQIFFSVFHSVSGFCNAGFSTLPDGLHESIIRFNYPVHLIIAVLVILGGMGFPITFNVFAFIRTKAVNILNRFLKNPSQEYHTRLIQVNSKIALATTFILLVFGFCTYLLFEQDASLAEHSTWYGKLVTSFFGSVTPRTAGFNTVDLTQLTLPTIMIYLLLMWIGASPSSTGGGIKTTTAAVAFLNLRSIIFGKNKTDVYRTQIAEQSINKAFAVILLSLLIIGLAVLMISVNDGKYGLLKIAFEVFSAFSTVGLTLGITPELSDTSKIVLALTMFIGRVGALTLLMAFVTEMRQQPYQYPVEEIMY